MLNWLICYLNSNGYYFYDSDYNYNQPNYNNYASYDCNYNGNYNQQPYYSPPRRQRGRRSKRDDDIVDARNRQKQLEAEKRKALEAANLKKGLETKIEEGNKGYELLVKMGYENGKGLGRKAEGILEPLPLAKKSDRKGLGAPGLDSTAATKSQLQNIQRKESHEAEEATVQAKKTKQQLTVAKKVAVAKPKQALKVKPQTVAVKPVVAQKPQQSTNEVKQKLETAIVRKLPQEVVTLSGNNVASSTVPQAVSTISTKSDKVKFSVKDPCTPEFMQTLGRVLNMEIELMQLRLAAEASLNQMHDNNELIVAKIYIDNNPNVADHVFEFIRTELVGWIGVYQQEGMATPIFHSITNNGSHITIVCENNYAFECLSRCIDDIVQMKTMESLKVLRLPPITPLIYCFDVKYEGIASDADLFLSQLQLHKPKLYTDNWVVASQEVCVEERKTFFIFLVDERSALALNFHYSRSFFICMQQVTFRNRGIIKETIVN
ncbi:septin and tuftelin-interacting protein 1 homolog [Calliphora vicina]|uniref:septin and tuftelin-interacting protein 1 homolog n=1 Tax=Calliphora vicina TaxID=7373 RepID=UPI00325AC8E7